MKLLKALSPRRKLQLYVTFAFVGGVAMLYFLPRSEKVVQMTAGDCIEGCAEQEGRLLAAGLLGAALFVVGSVATILQLVLELLPLVFSTGPRQLGGKKEREKK